MVVRVWRALQAGDGRDPATAGNDPADWQQADTITGDKLMPNYNPVNQNLRWRRPRTLDCSIDQEAFRWGRSPRPCCLDAPAVPPERRIQEEDWPTRNPGGGKKWCAFQLDSGDSFRASQNQDAGRL
jgi:hypothetical protein